MTQNKIYLFKPRGILGEIITLVTRCEYSHSAVEVDGVLYDASETRGEFGRSDPDIFSGSWFRPRRKYVVVEFSGDMSPWLDFMAGAQYDWKGVLGWIFRANDITKFYCFEATWAALKFAGITKTETMPDRLSGCDLLCHFDDENIVFHEV